MTSVAAAAAAAAVAVAVAEVHIAGAVPCLREWQQFRSKNRPPTGQLADGFTSKLPCNVCDAEVGRLRRRWKRKERREEREWARERERERETRLRPPLFPN